MAEMGPTPKANADESTLGDKVKFTTALEIIQERDSEQLDVDQLHQKILEQTKRISNFNSNWCHTTSEGSSGQKKLSSDARLRSKNNFIDTPNSMKNALFENKRLFFESFKNNFSIDNTKNPKKTTSVSENNLAIRLESINTPKSKREMQVILESQDNETRDFSRDKLALLRKFQEGLRESNAHQLTKASREDGETRQMNISEDSRTKDHRQIWGEKEGQAQLQFQKMRSSLSNKSSQIGRRRGKGLI